MSDTNEIMDTNMEENGGEINTEVSENAGENNLVTNENDNSAEKEEVSQTEAIKANPVEEHVVEKVEEPGDGNDETSKKKFISVKSIAVLLAAIVVVVLVVLLGGQTKGINGDTYRISSKAVGYAFGALYNQKAETKLWEEKGSYVQNFDRSALVYVVVDKTDRKTEYEVWYANNNLEPVKLDSVYSGDGVYQVNISDDGKYVVYVLDNGGDKNQNADVFIYDVVSGESTKVAKDVHPYSVVASPDCKTVAYISDYESDEDNKLYICELNKEAVKIAKDGCSAKAVTNNGKSVIYTNFVEDKLYYYNGKESVKIATDVNNNKFYINCREDEIVYVKDGKTYCYKAGAEEASKVYSSKINYFACNTINWCTENVSRLSVDSFSDAVFVDYDYKIYMIADKMDDAVKIASSYEDFYISSDGHSMVYGAKDELYLVKKLTGTPEGELIYSSEDIDSVISNSNMSKIYIVNEDDELIYVTKSGKHEMISNDVDDIYPVLCESNGKIYFVEDGDLYEAGTTKKSKTLVKSDVVEIKPALTGISYVTEEGNIGFIF